MNQCQVKMLPYIWNNLILLSQILWNRWKRKEKKKNKLYNTISKIISSLHKYPHDVCTLFMKVLASVFSVNKYSQPSHTTRVFSTGYTCTCIPSKLLPTDCTFIFGNILTLISHPFFNSLDLSIFLLEFISLYFPHQEENGLPNYHAGCVIDE